MSFSISASTPFSSINWDNFENRPPISKSMPFCKEEDWYEDKKCCMDGYSIEHVRDVAYEYGNQNTPEVKFLDQYPCINGIELDYFVDEIERMPSDVETKSPKPQFPSFECLSQTVFEGLKNVLPKPLLDSIEPYLCRQ
jgi:hypothetical protein